MLWSLTVEDCWLAGMPVMPCVLYFPDGLFALAATRPAHCILGILSILTIPSIAQLVSPSARLQKLEETERPDRVI